MSCDARHDASLSPKLPADFQSQGKLLYNNLTYPTTDYLRLVKALPLPFVIFILIVAAIFVALIGYWLFFLTEGAYLGERVVVWLYDLYARRYDAIKNWDIQDEIEYLAAPFVAEVGERRRPPLILDVAAGSGRLTLAVQRSGSTWHRSVGSGAAL